MNKGRWKYGMGLFATMMITVVFGSANPTTTLPHNGFAVKSEGATSTLSFEAPEYGIEEVTYANKTYQRLVAPQEGTAVESGEPALPSFTTFYAVSPGETYRAVLHILETETLQGMTIEPFQTQAYNEEIRPVDKKARLYRSNKQFPPELVQVSDPMSFRDLSVVSVTITPFQYRPRTGELTIIKKAEIELIPEGNRATDYHPPKRSRAFEPLYRALVVNYDSFMSLSDYQKPSILYILPSNASNILPTMNMLFDWRHRAGFVVNYASTSTIGNTTTAIKNYILNAYTTWANPPEFVALVGDASGSYSIPTYHETWSSYNGEGDHPYSLLVGNDILPEVFLGRLSFSSLTELATIVNKTVQYESNPYMAEDWFTRACMVGDPTPTGISAIITKEYIRELMESYGYTDVRTVYNDPFPSQMSANLNDGVSFFNYRGYYGVSGFSSSNVNGLTNGFKLTVATVITCGTGSFASGTALSESFIRAGSPTQPKGAVAAVGTATLGTHTMFNNAVDMGFYYGVFAEGVETAGAALVRGKLNLYLNYPTNPNNDVNIFSHWNNLMGDPALRMWTEFPKILIAAYNTTIDQGTNFIDVTVADINNDPIPDAFVTLLMGTDIIFESGWTNEQGVVTIPITTTTPGQIKLTITKKNYKPYQGTIQLTDVPVSVNVTDYFTVNDDSLGQSIGNGNGVVNGGETIELFVPLRNYGIQDGTGVAATLSSTNSQVSLLSDYVYYGDLPADSTVTPGQAFVFSVGLGLPDNTDLGLRLQITDDSSHTWEGLLSLTLEGALLNAGTVSIYDNGDGVLSPGETADIEILVSNGGSTVASNVTGTLDVAHPGIDVVDGEGTWGNLPPGQMSSNTVDRFTLTASDEIIPGTSIALILHLNTGNGYTLNTVLPLQIGIAGVGDPLGPDAHGYYIYDSGDQIYSAAPYYNWIEIDTRYGGSGTQLPLTDSGDDHDDVTTMSLPFTFRMYGVAYDQISICSNGWISMGATSMASFRNYQLPGPGGPSPMIAAFWDDLTTTNGGRVYSWYDPDTYQLIIEWSQMRTFQNNSLETFQVILRDPQHYYTPTGDGEIVIQYKTFNNTTTGSYGWGQIHGNYSTVGIEDHTETVGLEYTFNNQYPPQAMPLGNETALLITTRGADIRMRGDVNQDDRLDIFDVLMLVDYILDENTSNLNPYLADINQDSIVNILDMIGIVQLIMNY